MKKRTKRDLTLFFGVLVIIGSITLLTGQMSRQDLIVKYNTMRTELEQQELLKSDMLLEWTHMRKTKGKPKSGGKYAEEVLARDGDYINIIGFMVPQEQWVDVTEFLLLPLPLECYFCNMPPAHDVLLVKMAEGQKIGRMVNEPVIMNGKFTVNQGPDQKFFYTLSEATHGSIEGVTETKKDIPVEHMVAPSEHPGGEGGDGLMAPSEAPRVTNPNETD